MSKVNKPNIHLKKCEKGQQKEKDSKKKKKDKIKIRIE